MKHKDGLDIAAVLLLLLAAVAVMVVPVALVKPQRLPLRCWSLLRCAWCFISAAVCAPFWQKPLQHRL